MIIRSLRVFSIALSAFALTGCGEHSGSNVKSSLQSRFLISAADLPKAASLGLNIEGQESGAFLAFGSSESIARIQAAIPNSILQAKDVSEELSEHLEDHPEIAGELYTWDKVVLDLRAWADAHKSSTDLVQYGTTTKGRPLLALRVKSTAQADSTKPSVMITGATHGNEILTVDTVMGIARNVLETISSDRTEKMLSDVDVWFVPVVSPDSYVARQRQVDGVDPNRDYPWPDSPSHQSSKVIKAISDFATNLNLIASIDYHSVASVIMWPWAYTDQAPADATRYQSVARSMAETNRYEIGQISKVMYVAKGSSADYYLWKKGSMSFGIELSQSMPSRKSSGDDMVRENLESTLRFIEAAN